jgi:hypothetical protein
MGEIMSDTARDIDVNVRFTSCQPPASFTKATRIWCVVGYIVVGMSFSTGYLGIAPKRLTLPTSAQLTAIAIVTAAWPGLAVHAMGNRLGKFSQVQ